MGEAALGRKRGEERRREGRGGKGEGRGGEEMTGDTKIGKECGPMCFGCLRRGQICLVVDKYICVDVLIH